MPQNETSGYLRATNPVLGNGVSLYETDSGLFKTGDGSTAWNSLKYPTQTASLAVWGGYNPVLATGARGTATGLIEEFDSGVSVGVKVGDGATTWNQLVWVGASALTDWAKTTAWRITGSAVYDANTLELSSAAIEWPDGVAGAYTADTLNLTFATTDAWHATHGAQTVTQPAVTRDASGNITVQPALVVS
jgi:hypothetical protein